MSDTDLTFSELQLQALHDDFDSTKYLARVKQQINEAYRSIFRTVKVANATQLSTIAYSAGAVSIPIPSDSIVVEYLQDAATNVDLNELTQEDFDDLDGNVTGAPSAFTLDGATLRLWPKASAAGSLELRYRFNPVPLAADTDKPALPNEYRPMLAFYARSRLFAWEEDWDQAKEWMAQYNAKKLELIGDLTLASTANRVVPGTWSGTSAAPAFHRPGLF